MQSYDELWPDGAAMEVFLPDRIDEIVSAEGSEILDTIYDFMGRFIAFPEGSCRTAVVLWIAHTHLMSAWESTPRIAFLSPEPGSGKSRCLEVMELLVPRPVEAVNVTPAYIFRKVGSEDGRPTILFDEIDTVFGPKAKDNEEIRGLLNAGHRRGAVAGRCVVRGKLVETEEIPAYCAVALAGLGGLPDTILTRSVVIRMRRRAPNEIISPFRRREHAPEGHEIRDRLAAWAERIEPRVTGAGPEMPEIINDRDADVWEALLAVADAAGGEWPAMARRSAVALVALSKESTPSLGVWLLSDLQKIFGSHEHLSTDTILAELCSLEQSPWGDIKGKPLDSRGLARRLRPYDVRPGNIRLLGSIMKGYKREYLYDAWQRYLASPPEETATSATSATTRPVAVCLRCAGQGCAWCKSE
jgi:hypothetical protein